MSLNSNYVRQQSEDRNRQLCNDNDVMQSDQSALSESNSMRRDGAISSDTFRQGEVGASMKHFSASLQLERRSSAGSAAGASPPRKSSTSGPRQAERTARSAGQEQNFDEGVEQDRTEDAAAQPSWTEMKTKAGKERKRLPLACIACRRKKIRCSGEHPACQHCLRSRIPCVYRVNARKAAPRTDYMAMLDKRLKRMEERVIKIIPKDEQAIVAVTGRATVKPSASTDQKKNVQSKKRAADETLDLLDTWSKTNSQVPKRRHSADDSTQDQAQAFESDEKTLLEEGADRLPSKDLQEHLVEVFFDSVYGQSYHLLHKPSFLRRLAQDQVAPVLLLAVCAVSARFSDHPAVRTEPAFLRGEEWASAAREISLRRYDSPNLTILITYLILGLHEFGTCQGGRSWMFCGMAQRMSYALQLHQDLVFDPKSMHAGKRTALSATDQEIRRRAMWACFIMDRFCSSGTDRPTFISAEHIRSQLPIREAYFQMELYGPTEDLSGKILRSVPVDGGGLNDARDNMGVAAYTIRMIAIWGETIAYHNNGGKLKEKFPLWHEKSRLSLLKRAIQAWAEALPDRLKYRPDNLAAHASEKIANQFILMHIFHHQTVLFTNRFALPNGGPIPALIKDLPPVFVNGTAKMALEAANQVSTLMKEAMEYNVIAPFAGYAAFFASTVHVQGAFSKNPTLEASSRQYLTWNVNYLTKMKKFWGMFSVMTEELRELYRRQVDIASNLGSDKPAENEGREGIFQYGDWFDHYPHGVSGTEYDEPHRNEKEPGADASHAQKSHLQTVEEFVAGSTLTDANAAKQQRPRKASKRQHTVRVSNVVPQVQSAITEVNNDKAATQSEGPPAGRSEMSAPQNFATSFNNGIDANTQALVDAGSVDMLSYLAPQANLPDLRMYNPNNAQNELGQVDAIPGMNMSYGFGSMPNLAPSAGVAAELSGWETPASGVPFSPFNMDPLAMTGASTGPFHANGYAWSPAFVDANAMQPAAGSQPGMMMDQNAEQQQRHGM